ncbi:hypothetical protein HBI56_020100 [Parastagonospora nodorum]|uniref:Uncharacterized protein n=1 Tax=Phaeosphaeria nodorum (strain SN15 / ATCC MYA-4574 / FGSC 10173) TaxID=321614 RepID=A0A7U2HZJ7_PHANO|nr:hypothetical protein HBH56_079380 [Parastagonospora nodorum]QRC96463.1 hypothetical protein JI435_409110 [Parastagonospora nodorum SN15]KAH3929727.1 hypothetical protein HBH54_122440 [Parastagonospora nodorum]KAH3971346.1 hypothetical protein HBH51_112430 [Parastagonospora nodorum]KAH3982234.1 hypothetical protein HBH52_075550 [Parastagonospora nodorum]
MEHKLQHKEASARAVLSPPPVARPCNVESTRQHNAVLDTETQAPEAVSTVMHSPQAIDALLQVPRPRRRSYQQHGRRCNMTPRCPRNLCDENANSVHRYAALRTLQLDPELGSAAPLYQPLYFNWPRSSRLASQGHEDGPSSSALLAASNLHALVS